MYIDYLYSGESSRPWICVISSDDPKRVKSIQGILILILQPPILYNSFSLEALV